MAKQIEETRYLVIEHDKITRQPKTPKLVSNLNPFRKRFAPFASEAEFIEDCKAGITKRYGLEVRVATPDDVDKHGGDAEIHKVADRYNTADERAKQEKLDSARVIIPFFDDLVKTKEDLENALATYEISSTQLMAMAKDMRVEGIAMSEEFVKIYCETVALRSKKTKNPRTAANVRKAWDSERKVGAAGASANT